MSDSIKASDFITMGKIVGVHGVKGNLKVYSYAEDPAIFCVGQMLRVELSDGGRVQNCLLTSAHPHKRVLLMTFEGVTTCDQAEGLVGGLIRMPRAALPELEGGEYYWFDIIGLDVIDRKRGVLGKVMSIMPTGANDVYVVSDGDKETLVPALESVILEIDLDRQKMQVLLPEGL